MGTGGNDKKIKLWNIRRDVCENTTEVEGQVIGIHFSPWEHQMTTVQGSPANTVKIWSFQSSGMKLLATLEGHDNDILHSIHRGEFLITLAEDERMKFWQIFNPPKNFVSEEL